MPSRMNRRKFVKNTLFTSTSAALSLSGGLGAATSRAALANMMQATEWGNLTGRMVYDGKAPVPEKIKVDKDEATCGDCGLIDESLLVDPESGGLQNAIVYVYLKRGEEIPIHDSYAAAEKSEVVLNNEGCRFEPHVVQLRTTQQLVAKASDPIASNVKIDAFKNPSINVTIPSGQTYRPKQGFQQEERLPVPISCPVHFWEKAWLVVRDNPYMSVTDFNGYFEILHLPVGEWTFQFWHEETGYLDQVTQNGQPKNWRRGRVTVTIEPGNNDLGEIKVTPTEFEQ